MQSIARFLVFAMFSGITCFGAQEVDMCGMRSPASVVGQRLTLRARMAFTSHGGFLVTDKCPKSVPEAVLLFPHDPGAPDLGFELDWRVSGLIRPYLRLTGGASTACGTLVGEFIEKTGFKTKRQGGYVEGNGFGPQGVLRFAFVLQSIVDIDGCP